MARINGLLSIAKGILYGKDTGLQLERIIDIRRKYNNNIWTGNIYYLKININRSRVINCR
jgi:hypothetical protein